MNEVILKSLLELHGSYCLGKVFTCHLSQMKCLLQTANATTAIT